MTSKMNKALDEIAEKQKQTHVISVRSLDPSHFDDIGRLRHDGKVQLWKEIDTLIRRFDCGEVTLNPGKDVRMVRRSLPSPPPQTI